MTPGVPSLNLRPLSALFLLGPAWLVLTHGAAFLSQSGNTLYCFFLNEVLSRLIVLGLISWLVGWALGPRASRAIGDFWLALFHLLLRGIEALARGAMRLFR